LTPEDLRATNPGLVVGRMTGFGQNGPLAHQGGHDINYLALSGVLGALGVAGQPPLPPMNLLADFGGGAMILAIGVLSALLRARITGTGQDVDAAMVDGAALLMSMAYGNYGLGRWEPTQGADPFSGGRPFYATYRCSDGRYVALGASEPKFFRTLVDRLGLSTMIDVDRQTDPATWEAQRAAFTRTFASRPRDEWERLFADVDACVTAVLAPDEAPRHPHHAARGTFMTDEDGVVQPAPAPRFSESPTPPPRRAAVPGEHTDQVLTGLGLSSREIEALHASGTIG
jgi:alpha-methylacyl-CoA racemase